MPAVKTYTRVNFQNYPSTSTPLNATNLNKLDKGIDDLDDEVVTVKNAIENMSFDADSISYDNTSSGLQATDVQGAVDELNDNLTDGIGGTSDKFRFGTDGSGNYGYIKKVAGADTFFPFKKKYNASDMVNLVNGSGETYSNSTYTFTEDYDLAYIICDCSATVAQANITLGNFNGTQIDVSYHLTSKADTAIHYMLLFNVNRGTTVTFDRPGFVNGHSTIYGLK
jgi:hypothetical protein